MHKGHASTVTELDRVLVDAAGEGVVGLSWVADAEAMRAKVAEAKVAGATEIIFAPSGPDVGRELSAFARAMQMPA